MQRFMFMVVAVLGTWSVARTVSIADAAAGGGGGPSYPWYTMFNRGDANADLGVDISDAVYTFNHLFLGGAVPTCHDAADANDDGQLDISDALFTLVWLFRGETGPPYPGPQGFDREGWVSLQDDLDCRAYVDTQVRLIPYPPYRNVMPGQRDAEIAWVFLQASEPNAAVLAQLVLTIFNPTMVSTPVTQLRLMDKDTGQLLGWPTDADFNQDEGKVTFLTQIEVSTIRRLSIIGNLSPNLGEGERIEMTIGLPNDASFTHRQADHRVLVGPRYAFRWGVSVRHGRLDVSRAPTSPPAGTLVAKPDLWHTVGAWQFAAGPEALLVTNVHFLNVSDSRADRAISLLGLFDDHGTLRQTATTDGNHGIHFDLDRATGLLVPKNGSTTITLKVRLNAVESADGSGLRLWFALDTSRRLPIQAVGMVHGTELNLSDTGVARDSWITTPQIIRKTAPTVWRAGNPPFEFLAGDDLSLVCPLRIEAHRNGDVAIKGVKVMLQGQFRGAPLVNLIENGFQTASGEIVIPREFSFHQYNLDTRQVGASVADGRYHVIYGWRKNPGPAPGEPGGRCGNGIVEAGEECDGAPNCTATCRFTEFGEVAFILDDGIEELIPAGTSRFYAIKLKLNGLQRPGDFVEVSFGFDRLLQPNPVTSYPDSVDDRRFDGQVAMTAPVGSGGYALLWSDRSAVNHGAGNGFWRSSPDWTNDSYIEMDRTPWRLVISP